MWFFLYSTWYLHSRGFVQFLTFCKQLGINCYVFFWDSTWYLQSRGFVQFLTFCKQLGINCYVFFGILLGIYKAEALFNFQLL